MKKRECSFSRLWRNLLGRRSYSPTRHQAGKGGDLGRRPDSPVAAGSGGEPGCCRSGQCCHPCPQHSRTNFACPRPLVIPLCPFTFSNPFKSWLWTTTGSLYLYPQIFHKNFIVPTFSSNTDMRTRRSQRIPFG